VSEDTWNDVGLACFLLKIRDTVEVGTVFLLVGCRSERDVDMFASDPLIKVILNLKEDERIVNKRKLKLTTVSTKAIVTIGIIPFSENSGCITLSSSLFLNQTLLIIVCIRGAQNMPVFNMGSCQ